jgi:hypothetical protein
LNINNFQKLPRIRGDNEEETLLLIKMADEAIEYIKKFAWSPPLSDVYLAYGVGGIIGLFLMEFQQKIQGTDERLWVVVGDMPSAYLVVEEDDSPTEALERYCMLMDDWVAAVKKSGSLKDVYPVDAEPTLENAEMLQERINILRKEVIYH